MPTAANPPEEGRLPELDGIRGLAVLFVIFFHFGRYFPERINWANSLYRGIKGFGWSGVDLFFVLSGFLITGILLRTRRSRNYFSSFYARRSLRILPIYFLAVFLFFDCGLPQTAHAFTQSPFTQLWYWLPLSNWQSAFDPLAYSPIGHFWSLAVEEQFYLLWPLAIFFLPEDALIGLSLAGIAASALLRNLPAFQAIQLASPEFLYRLTPFRLDGLFCGALLALTLDRPRIQTFVRRHALHIFLAALLVLALVTARAGFPRYTTEPMTRFGYTALALAYASMVGSAVVSTGSRSWLMRLYRSRPLTACGKYSYAMYIVQTPISLLVPIEPFLALCGIRNGCAVSVLSVLIGLLLSFLVARLSWSLIEQPCLRLKRRFRAL